MSAEFSERAAIVAFDEPTIKTIRKEVSVAAIWPQVGESDAAVGVVSFAEEEWSLLEIVDANSLFNNDVQNPINGLDWFEPVFFIRPCRDWGDGFPRSDRLCFRRRPHGSSLEGDHLLRYQGRIQGDIRKLDEGHRRLHRGQGRLLGIHHRLPLMRFRRGCRHHVEQQVL